MAKLLQELRPEMFPNGEIPEGAVGLLTSDQMEGIWKGADRSGTFGAEPEWKQLEVEEKFKKETKQLRARLFWILIEAEELKNKLIKPL